MKNKARKAKVTDEEPEFIILLPKVITDKCNNEEIIKIISEFEATINIEARITLIRSLAAYLNSDDSEYIVLLLSYLFVHLCSKSPVKKTILRIFSNLQNAQISNEIAEQLLILISQTTTSGGLTNCISAINDCFNNCPPGVQAIKIILTEVLEFLIKNLKILIGELSLATSPIELQELHVIVHNVTRCTVSITQLNNAIELLQNYRTDILNVCKLVLCNPGLVFDTKSNCGILIATVINYQSDTAFSDLLQLCLSSNEPKWGLSSLDFKDDIAITCICSGILNVAKPDKLGAQNPRIGAPILLIIAQKLLEIANRSADNPTVSLGVNRGVLLVSRSLEPLAKHDLEQVLNDLLDYVMTQLDHSSDTVRHLARSIFVNFVKLGLKQHNSGYTIPLDFIVKTVLRTPILRNSRYTALSVIANECGCTNLLKNNDNFVVHLLDLLQDSSISNYVVTCYETLMRSNLKETTENQWFNIWVLPLTVKLAKSLELDETESCLQNLLIVAIKLRPKILDSILAQWSTESELQLSSLLKCALIARKIGASTKTGGKWRGILDFSILQLAKCHQNDEIRIASLALIAESHKSTEIFSEIELKFIISFLYYNINTQLPSTRQQILSLIKKIFNRFAESYYAILRDYNKHADRNTENSAPNPEFTALKCYKTEYETFLFDLRRCVLNSLFPGANFSRRLISLEILTLIEVHHWTKPEVDAILTCLSDSYESNKRLAVSLLERCPVEMLGLNDCVSTKSYLSQALKLASSIKPADTVTAAYMLEASTYSPVLSQVLLDLLPLKSPLSDTKYLLIALLTLQLKNEVIIAKRSLLEASCEAPMHGLIFCLRHLLEKFMFNFTFNDVTWRALIGQIIDVCFEINRLVAPIVNNSSPEGHLPMDHVSCAEDATITSQMLLVCSWRSVKEVSLLLGDLTLNSQIVDQLNVGLITESQILKIGEHFTVLLTETKHRGAFEQAYVGFTKLCTRLWKCSSENLHTLPVVWLTDILDAISGKGNNSKLCATRRSAGVPFMIQAIIASELQTGGKLNFQQCISTLLRYANTSDDNIEIRTHSMNILRALYRHTQLAEIVTPFIADGVIISIEGFGKTTWAERNSATLLFSSLMTRIFGVQRSKDTETLSIRNRMTSNVFFMRYPAIYPFLRDQLKDLTAEGCPPCKEVTLYPILLLLARLYPGSGEEKYNQLNVFVPFVRHCAKNKSLKTRELAAKALVPLIPNHDRQNVVVSLFKDLQSQVWDQNLLHGILLQIEQLLRQTNEFNDFEALSVIKGTEWILSNNNLVISTLYLQIINLVTRAQKLRETDWNFIFETPTDTKHFKIGHKLFENTKLITQLNVTSKFDLPIEIITNKLLVLIINSLKSNSFIEKQLILNVLIYLLQNSTDFEIADSEIDVVNSFSNEVRILLGDKLNSGAFFRPLKALLSEPDGKLTGKALAVLSCFPTEVLNVGHEYSKDLFLFYTQKVYSEPDAIMNCIRSCFTVYDQVQLDCVDWDIISDILYEFSAIEKSLNCRLCIALIMTENSKLLFDIVNFKIDFLFTMWQVVFQLLDDSEPIVRNTIAKLTVNAPIAEKSRKILLNDCIQLFSNISESNSISALIYWAIIDHESINFDDDIDQEPVFDIGETSTYIENMCLSLLSAELLAKILHSDRQTTISAIFKRIIVILNKNDVFWKCNMQEKNMLISVFAEFAQNTSETAVFDAYSISKIIEKHIWFNVNDKFKFKACKIVEFLIPK